MSGKNPIGPLDYARRWPLRLWVGAVILFLYVPLASLVAFSFNDSRRTIRWEGFTLDWYGTLANDDALIAAFTNSLTIAFLSMIVSVVLGALTAIALWRSAFRARACSTGRSPCRSSCRKSAWAWGCWCSLARSCPGRAIWSGRSIWGPS